MWIISKSRSREKRNQGHPSLSAGQSNRGNEERDEEGPKKKVAVEVADTTTVPSLSLLHSPVRIKSHFFSFSLWNSGRSVGPAPSSHFFYPLILPRRTKRREQLLSTDADAVPTFSCEALSLSCPPVRPKRGGHSPCLHPKMFSSSRRKKVEEGRGESASEGWCCCCCCPPALLENVLSNTGEGGGALLSFLVARKERERERRGELPAHLFPQSPVERRGVKTRRLRFSQNFGVKTSTLVYKKIMVKA